MFRIFHQAVIATALCLCSFSVNAQLSSSGYEVGINAGTFLYQGDLTPSAVGSFKTMRLGFGVWGARKISNTLSIRANIAAASIKGDDARYSSPDWRQQRNLSFTSSIKEFSALAVWDVYGGRTALAPYVFTGVGYAFVKIKRDYSAFNATYFTNDKAATEGLAIDIARTPPRGIPVVPIGAGLRYSLTSNLSIHGEVTYRLTSTDYLDGFSQVANPNRQDHYQSVTFGLIYSFGKKGKLGCPVIRQ
jgi:OOP family OmpA-OmpF porin